MSRWRDGCVGWETVIVLELTEHVGVRGWLCRMEECHCVRIDRL